MNKLALLSIYVLTIVSIVGCGGGGGSSNGASTSIDLENASDSYTGKRDPATITETNYGVIVKSLFDNAGVSDPLVVKAAATDQGFVKAGNFRIINAMGNAVTPDHIKHGSVQRTAVSESVVCTGGGTVAIAGDLDDSTLAGTLNMTYSNCSEDGVVLDGQAVMVIHHFNQIYNDFESFTLSYSSLSVEEGNESYHVTGTSLVNHDFANGKTTITDNLFSNKGGKQKLYENYVAEVMYSGLTVTGKIYHEDLGFVTVMTESPLRYSNSSSTFPDSGGPVIITGVSEKKLRLMPEQSGTQIRVEMDFDGNGTYELFSILDDSISITTPPQTTNIPPTALVTGGKNAISLNVEVVLDGSGRSDSNAGDVISYSWDMTGRPESSQATLSDTVSATTSFTADVPGTYEITFTVTDPLGASDSKVVSLIAVTAPLPLSHDVVDAVYSKSADRLIAVTSTPSFTLRVIDPETGITEQLVDLPKIPSSVSASADGTKVAVGYDAWVGYYQVNDLSLGSVWGVPLSVGDVEVDNSGFIYLSPTPGTQWDSIYTFDTTNQSTNAHTGLGNVSIYAGSKIKLQPGAQALYAANNGLSPSDVNKLDISSNPAVFLYDSPYHGDYDFGGDLWFTEDGGYFITPSGNLFLATSEKSTDMQYRGSALLNSGYEYRLTHADHTLAKNRFVTVISDRTDDYFNPDSEIRILEVPFLSLKSTFSFKNYSLDGSQRKASALFSFYKRDGSKYYVIAKTTAASAAEQDGYYLMRFE